MYDEREGRVSAMGGVGVGMRTMAPPQLGYHGFNRDGVDDRLGNVCEHFGLLPSACYHSEEMKQFSCSSFFATSIHQGHDFDVSYLRRSSNSNKGLKSLNMCPLWRLAMCYMIIQSKFFALKVFNCSQTKFAAVILVLSVFFMRFFA